MDCSAEFKGLRTGLYNTYDRFNLLGSLQKGTYFVMRETEAQYGLVKSSTSEKMV